MDKWHRCHVCGYRYTTIGCRVMPSLCKPMGGDTCALCAVAEYELLITANIVKTFIYEDELMQLVFESRGSLAS